MCVMNYYELLSAPPPTTYVTIEMNEMIFPFFKSSLPHILHIIGIGIGTYVCIYVL